jgi:adenylate cyclase
MNSDISETVTHVLRREEIENEKKIHLVRLTVLLLTMLMISVARISMGEIMQTRFLVVLPIASLYLALGLFLWVRYIRQACPPIVSYSLALLDLVYVVVLTGGFSAADPADGGLKGFLNAPPLLFLFVLNAMSGLRYNLKVSSYSALTSVLIVFAMGLYDYTQTDAVSPSGIVLDAVRKAALVGGTALISGYVGYRSKGLIVLAVQEQEEKKFIRQIFGRHASESVVEDALRRGLQLSGEEKEITILISDIRDFTPLAEKLPPGEIVELLNSYFTEMVDVISQNGGTVNKFMGDGLLAIFGAPVSHPNNAERAVRAALAMLERLAEFNSRQAAQGRAELRQGIGIGTGRVVVGNIGSTERMEYTVIGDAVNLSARLEELNKEFGTSILISQTTYQQVEAIIQATPLKPVNVKGKEQSVMVYAVTGIKQPSGPPS